MLCVCFLPDTLCRFFHVVYGRHLWEFRILYVPYICVPAGSWCLTALYWGTETNRRVEKDVNVVCPCVTVKITNRGSKGIR